jgi:hypothetical protein
MRDEMCITGGLLVMWGVVSRFWFAVLVAASQKTLISALRKWKNHLSWDETKIDICCVPRHHKGHARVRYGVVPTNYAMIMAEPSSFNLKAMQPERGRSFL